MVKVKICGITNVDDALEASELGADALGFVFYRESPRYVSPDQAKEIIQRLPPFITTVGVFVDMPPIEVEEIMRHVSLDMTQLHGHESPDVCVLGRRVIKAIRVKELIDLERLQHYRVSAFLLDTYAQESFGGTGQIFNWDIALHAKQFGKIILAGGLNPGNVEKAVQWVKPYGVDVSSGVEERKGKKDRRKMELFIKRVKGAL